MRTLLWGMIGMMVLWGCRSSRSEDRDSRVLTITYPFESPSSTAELIDSLEYISLEVSDSALFGHIMVCNYTPEKFFILGSETDRNIKVFDATGKYLNHVGTYGRGPGEYVNILSWSIERDTVIIGDLMQNKLLLYRDDGRLISEEVFPDQLRDIFGRSVALGIEVRPLKEGYFVLMNGNVMFTKVPMGAAYALLDRELRLKSTRLPEAGAQPSYQGMFAFNNPQSDTIFLVNENGELARRIFIDFGESRVTPEVRKNLDAIRILNTKSFVTRSFLIGNYVLLDMCYKGKRVRGVVDWKTGRTYLNDDNADNRHKILNFAAVSTSDRSVIAFIPTPGTEGFKELPADMQTALEENGGAVLLKYKLKNDF